MYNYFTDIVEGNIKSIMRLILALAAHFKPNSVKQSSAANVDSPAAADSPAAPSPNTSVSGIAHVSAELSWGELTWGELSWGELTWGELSWSELSWGEP